MEFRPCIDIHNGKVKQIVGGTLSDSGAKENFVSERGAGYFAEYYRDLGITGGHIIMLNKAGTPEYEASRVAAMEALSAYPGGLQVGGGINAENAGAFIEAGASHVIVTSYVFSDGKINYENLSALVAAVGREHVVLDLSCRKKGDDYYIVTDRWQKFTRTKLTASLLKKLEKYCSEYLIHAVDVEGKAAGPDRNIFRIFNDYLDKVLFENACLVTYAGGIHSYKDIIDLKKVSRGRVNITVGSALDLFGGKLSCENICYICNGSLVSKSYDSFAEINRTVGEDEAKQTLRKFYIENLEKEKEKDNLYSVKKDDYWFDSFSAFGKDKNAFETYELFLVKQKKRYGLRAVENYLIKQESKVSLYYDPIGYLESSVDDVLCRFLTYLKLNPRMSKSSGFKKNERDMFYFVLTKKRKEALLHYSTILGFSEKNRQLDNDYWTELYKTLGNDEKMLAKYLTVLTYMNKKRELSLPYVASVYSDLAELFFVLGYKDQSNDFFIKALENYKNVSGKPNNEIESVKKAWSFVFENIT